MSLFEVELPCLAGLGLILLFGVIAQRGTANNTWLLPLGFTVAALMWGWWHEATWSDYCLFPLWALLLFFLGSELIRRWIGTASVVFYWVSTFLVIVMKTN